MLLTRARFACTPRCEFAASRCENSPPRPVSCQFPPALQVIAHHIRAGDPSKALAVLRRPSLPIELHYKFAPALMVRARFTSLRRHYAVSVAWPAPACFRR